MAQWQFDFGDVIHWNDDKLENEVLQVYIEYDSNMDFPVKITTTSTESLTISECKELTVTYIDETKNQIEICDELYLLTDDQLFQFKQYGLYWKQKDLIKRVLPFVRKEIDKSFGLVFYYDKKIHNYVMAELKIEFKETNPKEGKMTVDVFSNETQMMIDKYFNFFMRFEFQYKGINADGLQRYIICGDNFLLTQFQAQKLCGLYEHMEEYQ